MKSIPQRILVIQTAFIGDVILATSLLEKLHHTFPKSKIDYLIRKGNESLVFNHPFINELIIWNKQDSKYRSLYQLLKKIRASKYDVVINTQRFGATGMLTAFSGAPVRSGFAKNPFSLGFTHSAPHEIGNGTHEVERNQKLIAFLTDSEYALPKLYPSSTDFDLISQYSQLPFVTISPSSVWFTKQYPMDKWVDLIDQLPSHFNVFLLGGPGDQKQNEVVISKCKTNVPQNLAGKLRLLQSAALMRTSKMNYVNDSGPLHLCSAMNAPVTSVFCSTVPEFGFTPLSSIHYMVEGKQKLDCRPCGLHGLKKCPKGHFKCANNIETKQLLNSLNHNSEL